LFVDIVQLCHHRRQRQTAARADARPV
jgi:hypothetical protein